MSTETETREQTYPMCGAEISDGNRDDPSYAFCGHPRGHMGEHGDWQL